MAGTERRYVGAAGLRVERRAGEGERPPAAVMVGHASVFDEWTTIHEGRYWTFREIVRPGAYARAIEEEQDVRSLFNHDANFILGRTRSGTLRLKEDKRGLYTETDLPDTQAAADLRKLMERGDITGMSFAFIPRRGGKVVETEAEDGSITVETAGERITEYERDGKLFTDRELLDADLFDVSAVVYPAYEGTDVGLRAAGQGFDPAAMEAEAARRWAARKRGEAGRRARDLLGLRLGLCRLTLSGVE